MDYLCFGSNGFAQVGQQDYILRNKAEMSVLIEYLQDNFPIPEEFSQMCQYRAKWFQHDFGNYSEIVIFYNDRILECWEEEDPDKASNFWKT